MVNTGTNMIAATDTLQITKTPDESKVLLVVEDCISTQNLLLAGLSGLSGFQVIIAGNGVEALEVLKERIVNVIVTDLQMPVMDGFELLSIIYERYPHIPVLVMTALTEASHHNAPLSLGALRILSKPVKLSVLMEQVKEAASYTPDGVIQGITLSNLLQLMNWECKSCTVVAESEQGMGMLYLQEGALVHASFKEFEGLDAAYKILSCTGSHIKFTSVCRVNRTINISLTEVLLNAAMHKDMENKVPSG